MKLPMYKTGY